MDKQQVIEYLCSLDKKEIENIIFTVDDVKPFIEREKLGAMPTCVRTKAKLMIEYELSSLFDEPLKLAAPSDRGYGALSPTKEEIISKAKTLLTKNDFKYDLIVDDWGNNSLHKVKLLRDLTGKTLYECRTAILSSPVTLFSGLDRYECALILDLFESYGITAHTEHQL